MKGNSSSCSEKLVKAVEGLRIRPMGPVHCQGSPAERPAGARHLLDEQRWHLCQLLLAQSEINEEIRNVICPWSLSALKVHLITALMIFSSYVLSLLHMMFVFVIAIQ